MNTRDGRAVIDNVIASWVMDSRSFCGGMMNDNIKKNRRKDFAAVYGEAVSCTGKSESVLLTGLNRKGKRMY